MPQSRPELKAKFFKDGDDGILKCERIIGKYGGSVHKGMITAPITDPATDDEVEELWDAIEYLCNEWDYDIKK